MAMVNVQQSNDEVKAPPAAPEDGTQQQGEEQPYLGTWKTKEAAEEGFQNMKRLLDQQGNELGSLRKQTEFMMRQQQQPQQKSDRATGTATRA